MTDSYEVILTNIMYSLKHLVAAKLHDGIFLWGEIILKNRYQHIMNIVSLSIKIWYVTRKVVK